MKLVILDAYAENPGDLSWDWLKNVVEEYEIYDITPPEKVIERSIDADILVTNKTVLTAEILSQFPENVRLDLIMRIATLEEVQPAAFLELNEIMEKQFAGTAGSQSAKIGGLKSAADIMNYLDSSTETQLMNAIQSQDKEIGNQIQDLMFVFDNLNGVDDRSIQTLLRDVPSDVLQKALKGADDGLKEKFFKNMSSRAAASLREDLASMGPTKLSDVEAAQNEILTIARKLADSGAIMLSRGGGSSDFI